MLLDDPARRDQQRILVENARIALEKRRRDHPRAAERFDQRPIAAQRPRETPHPEIAFEDVFVAGKTPQRQSYRVDPLERHPAEVVVFRHRRIGHRHHFAQGRQVRAIGRDAERIARRLAIGAEQQRGRHRGGENRMRRSPDKRNPARSERRWTAKGRTDPAGNFEARDHRAEQRFARRAKPFRERECRRDRNRAHMAFGPDRFQIARIAGDRVGERGALDAHRRAAGREARLWKRPFARQRHRRAATRRIGACKHATQRIEEHVLCETTHFLGLFGDAEIGQVAGDLRADRARRRRPLRAHVATRRKPAI